MPFRGQRFYHVKPEGNGTLEVVTFVCIDTVRFAYHDESVWVVRTDKGKLIRLPLNNSFKVTAEEAWKEYLAYQQQAVTEYGRHAKFYQECVEKCKENIDRGRAALSTIHRECQSA